MDIVKGHHRTKNSHERPEAIAKASRSSIIAGYLRVLERLRGPLAAELELPFPKEQISRAILDELADAPGCDSKNRLEIGYVLLESFVPYDEYRAVEDFKDASLYAERICDSQDPSSILKSARIMKKVRGERAVRVQEIIHERMQKRQLELLELHKGEAA